MRTINRIVGCAASALGAGLALAGSGGALADSVEEFYRGKKVSIVIGQSPGGSYDTYARMTGRHIGKHIPGNPTFVSQNMTGAGGRTAATWMHAVAPKDGTAIAMISQTIPMDQVLQPGGAQFDARQFNWIGNPFRSNNILVVWHTTGVTTIEQAKTREIAIGGTGPSSPDTLYPRVANSLLGTKFKIIPGYKGGSEIDLAMERGEVGGRGSNSWQTLKSESAAWIAEKKVHVLLQIGPEKEPDLDVPLLTDLADSPESRRVLEFISSSLGMGRPMFTTAEVPAERVAALRKAFMATMADPEFLAEAKGQNMTVNAVSGEALQQLVERTVNTPPEIVARARDLMLGAGGAK